MSKIYKGYELIKEIAEGNIKDYTKIIPHYDNCTIDYFIYSYGFMDAYYKDSRHSDNRVNVCIFLDNDNTFEVIEDEEIDIDSIEEIKLSEYDREHYVAPIRNNTDKINELIKAVKQLNGKIKEKE